MRTLLISPLLLTFVALSIGSSGSTMEDEDGGPFGSDGGGQVDTAPVAEEVVDGIAAAETYTLAIIEGGSNNVGGLSITTYTGTAACSLSEPVGDAYEIYVNLDRNSGCNYTTTVCTEDDLCFAQSAGAVWANKYVSNSLDDSVRASAGAIVMRHDLFGIDDPCTIDIDLGWPDGTSFSASYELDYSGASLCYEITP